MPKKGNGHLQLKGVAVKNMLVNMPSSPFASQSLQYWAYTNYSTKEDEKIISKLLKTIPFFPTTRQLRQIIKYTKEKLK